MTTKFKDGQGKVRLPAEPKDPIKSYETMCAATDHLNWRSPRIEDLKEAVAAADRGDFASDAEAAAVFARYAGPEIAAQPRR